MAVLLVSSGEYSQCTWLASGEKFKSESLRGTDSEDNLDMSSQTDRTVRTPKVQMLLVNVTNKQKHEGFYTHTSYLFVWSYPSVQKFFALAASCTLLGTGTVLAGALFRV